MSKMMTSNTNFNITEHFTLQEMTTSLTAYEEGIDNSVTSPIILCNLVKLCIYLEHLRKILGGKPIRINSAYRCPRLNVAVGGHARSYHMKGLAADIRVDGILPISLCGFIRSYPHPVYKVECQKYDTFVHVEIINSDTSSCQTTLLPF